MLDESAQILSTHCIYSGHDRFAAWPSIARTTKGELLVVFSGDRLFHVDPYGKTLLTRSMDQGLSWTPAQIINNTPFDDRDPGIILTPKGTLVVSFFTSRMFMDWTEQAKEYYGTEAVEAWKPFIDKVTPEDCANYLGAFIRRSEDGGRSWGPLIRTPVQSSHGPVLSLNGDLIYLGSGYVDGVNTLQFCRSTDDGKTWEVLGDVCPYDVYDHVRFHEPQVVEMPDGRLIGMLRANAALAEDRRLYQTESLDGGRTWNAPADTGLWGLPPHLLLHSTGVLVVVYGHRRLPFGERAALSYDGGNTWERELVLQEVDFEQWKASSPVAAEDDPAEIYYEEPDLGYPASVELEDGSIYTVYYQSRPTDGMAEIHGVRWRLP